MTHDLRFDAETYGEHSWAPDRFSSPTCCSLQVWRHHDTVSLCVWSWSQQHTHSAAGSWWKARC